MMLLLVITDDRWLTPHTSPSSPCACLQGPGTRHLLAGSGQLTGCSDTGVFSWCAPLGTDLGCSGLGPASEAEMCLNNDAVSRLRSARSSLIRLNRSAVRIQALKPTDFNSGEQ